MVKDVIWISVAILLIEGMFSMTWLKENWLFVYDVVAIKWIDFKNKLGGYINV